MKQKQRVENFNTLKTIKKGNTMEKENKKLQITFNGEMLEIMEKIAQSLGMTINQYIVYVVTKDIDNRLQK